MTEPLISFRLTQIDIVSLAPADNSPLGLKTSPFLPAGQQLSKVPVVRIFGATPAGQRVLAHLHGAMAYFYLQYDGPTDPDTVHRFIRRLGHALNYATAASLGQISAQNPTDRSSHQYVAYIALCKGVPFYGFHVGYRYFLKIYCLQARFKKRMADLLRRGKIIGPFPHSNQPMDTKASGLNSFKIFEEHIPFHLQFMIDHNLYGCGIVELSRCTFRRPLPDDQFDELRKGQIYSAGNVPKDCLGPPGLAKMSYCTLELDCHVSDIINRHIVGERQLHDNFHEFLRNPLDHNEKFVHSVKELWEHERRRRTARDMPAPEEVRESSQRDYGQGDQPEWAMESEFRQQICELVEQDLRKGSSELKFQSFLRPESELSKLIPTTFQAVEAIHVSTWVRDELDENPYGVWAINGIGTGHRAHEQAVPFVKVEIGGGFAEDDVCAAIDVSALQSQMEDYKDDGLEEEQEGGGVNAGVEEDEDAGLDWDEPAEANEFGHDVERDRLATPRKPKTGLAVGRDGTASPAPRRYHSVTPRKAKHGYRGETGVNLFSPSKAHLHSTHSSPSTTPSKHTLVDHFSPRKADDALPSSKHGSAASALLSANCSPSALRKRTSQEQDDGFAYPKAGKLMKFIKRGPSSPSRATTSVAPDLTEASDCSVTGPSVPNTACTNAPLVEPGLLDDLTLSDFSLTPSTAPNNSQLPIHPSIPPLPSSLLLSSKRLNFALFNTQRSPRLNLSPHSSWYRYSDPSPRMLELRQSLVPAKIYRDPYYSNPVDVPARRREYAGRSYMVSGSSLRFVPEFHHEIGKPLLIEKSTGVRVDRWEFANQPPRLQELRARTIGEKSRRPENFLMISQIEGPTQRDKYTPIKKAQTEGEEEEESQHMDVLAIEVHARNRDNLRPDPAQDEIEVLFYCLKSHRPGVEHNGRRSGTRVGMIIVEGEGVQGARYGLGDYVVEVVETELDLLNRLIEKVRAWDPEVLTGFELESWSWGYVMYRGREMDFDVVHEFGRVRRESHGRFAGKDDKWGYTHGSSIRVSGRHVLSIWRIIRSDFAVTQYTFENLVFHILHKRSV